MADYPHMYLNIEFIFIVFVIGEYTNVLYVFDNANEWKIYYVIRNNFLITQISPLFLITHKM